MCGTSGTTVSTDLPNMRNVFEPGNTDEFPCSFGDIGELQKIRIESDNYGSNPSWLIDTIIIDSLFTRSHYKFTVNRWLSSEIDGGHLVREFPVDSTGLEIKTYQVVVDTIEKGIQQLDDSSQKKKTRANSGKFKAYVNLYGSIGDTGKRILRRMADKTPEINFKSGKATCFNLEAVDLGDINSLLIGFSGDDNIKWRVGKVYVKLDNKIDVFVCGRTLGKGEADKRTEFVIYRDDEASIDVAETVFEPLATSAKPASAKPKTEKESTKGANAGKGKKGAKAGRGGKAKGAGKETPSGRSKAKVNEDQNAMLQGIDQSTKDEKDPLVDKNKQLEQIPEDAENQINEPEASEPNKEAEFAAEANLEAENPDKLLTPEQSEQPDDAGFQPEPPIEQPEIAQEAERPEEEPKQEEKQEEPKPKTPEQKPQVAPDDNHDANRDVSPLEVLEPTNDLYDSPSTAKMNNVQLIEQNKA
ncbi:uncharacterized protein LOC142358514 [Convolutriloba macropyga]|uniref:uncharacterized protein LOC142358514 n=1 Tax=Convolutriloba macropyga TaxID=536237 RepID=UPI003F51EAEC